MVKLRERFLFRYGFKPGALVRLRIKVEFRMRIRVWFRFRFSSKMEIRFWVRVRVLCEVWCMFRPGQKDVEGQFKEYGMSRCTGMTMNFQIQKTVYILH